MTRKPLLILGAGTFAIEALEAAELSGHSVRGFVVSDEALRSAERLENLPVFTFADLPFGPDDVDCIAGIISTKRRAIVAAAEARGFAFASVRHPSAIVSPRVVVSAGSLIGAGAIVSAHSTIGPHVILNRGANVAHDVALAPFATVGPNAVIAGAVTVGRGAWIGVGAVVRDHLEIGDGAVVGAGAVVVKAVPPHTLVAGSPATIMKEGVDGY